MKIDEFEKLPPLQRREFLQQLGAFLALPVISSSTKFAVYDLLVGKAHAQMAAAPPLYFLEVNLRDQWDWGHVFVPPSIARNYDSIRSRIALFDTPIAERNNFYVTPQAAELRPHLDSIAVMELGECVLSGAESVHGHEAGNPLRSPGRSKVGGAGRRDMATVDRRPGLSGNEILYSSTPTPLILHNYYQKTLNPAQPNGVLIRNTLRPGLHTYYHFEADLANAQVDRFMDRNTLLSRFGNSVPLPQTFLDKYGAVVARLLKKVDDAYLTRVVAEQTTRTQQAGKLTALEAGLTAPPQMAGSIALTTDERAYWTNGVPQQVICSGDDAATCNGSSTTLMNPGELFGYAFKLFRQNRARSVGIDFDIFDVHTNRNRHIMTTMAAQSALPLARLIQSLKNAGMYDQTVIALYTLDGSRSPLPSSTGDGTKNAIVLAGGAIKGGYYGDIRLGTSGGPVYCRPDDNGVAVATGTTGRDQRVPAADVYRTVATAAGIPSTLIDRFPDARNGRVLRYMLK